MIAGSESFLLHYNFPPFATGEAKAYRGVGRREIGHGNLAHRALQKVMPVKGENYPYTTRVVSDILESNGSSSMATVCAGCLALMDAGVPISRPVSGIAMGLIADPKTGKYAILSDILGDEDHLGDMDFKVCGTEKGITATQMDIKVDGLSYATLEEALNQAKRGREHILGKMLETLPGPRPTYKDYAPQIETMVIPKDLIGAVIGPGGKIIQEIQATTNTIIAITEENEKGYVEISASNAADMKAARAKINAIVKRPEVGEVYTGVVKGITTFGAFVEILPNCQGLLHISEIDWKRIKTVKIIEIDTKSNKIRLSRKALLPKPEKPHHKREEREENANGTENNTPQA